MPNYQDDAYKYDPSDPYAVDIDTVVKENSALPANKVNWHRLPEGESKSTWRIFPWVQKHSFFLKVVKHFSVPGVKGALTCPRTFMNPETDAKYDCAIDEQRWVWEKSKNENEVGFAKLMKGSVQYYVNAVNMDNPDAGVGVLTLPHAVWKVLFDWLTTPGYQLFYHPFHGRNIIIKSSETNATVPGTNFKKRDFTVTPESKETMIEKEEWLEQLYDLNNILGIPTYEFTKICVQRLVTGDPNYGQDEIKQSGAYLKRLTGDTDFNFNNHNEVPPSEVLVSHNEPASVSLPLASANTVPVFATAPVTGKVLVPTTETGADGHRLCFGQAFDEDNKVCLKCPENDPCELAVLKAAHKANKAKVAVEPANVASDEVADQMKVLLKGNNG